MKPVATAIIGIRLQMRSSGLHQQALWNQRLRGPPRVLQVQLLLQGLRLPQELLMQMDPKTLRGRLVRQIKTVMAKRRMMPIRTSAQSPDQRTGLDPKENRSPAAAGRPQDVSAHLPDVSARVRAPSAPGAGDPALAGNDDLGQGGAHPPVNAAALLVDAARHPVDGAHPPVNAAALLVDA